MTMLKHNDHHRHRSSVLCWTAMMMRAASISTSIIVILAAVACSVAAAFENFPTSTRQALAQKAKELNPTSTSSGGGFAYTTSSWSNRAATVLTPICLDPSSGKVSVYTADRPFLWNSIDVGCRMTVIELPSSKNKNKNNKPDLWVHSPVGLDGPLRDAMAKLGTVKYVVSPNYEHVKFAPAWHLAYPQADMWACPGLSQRMENVQWKGEIPNGLRPPGWKKQHQQGASDDKSSSSVPEGIWDTNILQALHVNIEANPFTGKPFFNEVIFYHVPTKTLVTTDFYWNYPSDTIPNKEHGQDDAWKLAPVLDEPVPLKSRAWKVGMDKIFAPFYNNLMVTDSNAHRDICRHVLDEWQVETIIPAHGDIIRGKQLCRSVLTKFFPL